MVSEIQNHPMSNLQSKSNSPFNPLDSSLLSTSAMFPHVERDQRYLLVAFFRKVRHQASELLAKRALLTHELDGSLSRLARSTARSTRNASTFQTVPRPNPHLMISVEVLISQQLPTQICTISIHLRHTDLATQALRSTLSSPWLLSTKSSVQVESA